MQSERRKQLEAYWKRRNLWSNRLPKISASKWVTMPCYIVRFFKFWAEVLIWSLLTKTSFPLPSIQCVFPMFVLLLLCSWIWIFCFLLMVKWWWYWNWSEELGLWACFLSGFSPDLISDSQTLKRTVWCLCSLGPFLTNTSCVRWPPYVSSFHTVAVYLGGGREEWLHIYS